MEPRLWHLCLPLLMMVSVYGAWASVPTTYAQATERVTGSVTYRERIALPAGAVVTVTLEDVSLQDVASTVIAEQRITTTGNQVPFPFELAYDPATIQARNTYAVRARIEINGELRWTTTQRYAVITSGNPLNVDLVLKQVAQPDPGTTPAPVPANTLTGTWRLLQFQRSSGNVEDTSGTDLTILFEDNGNVGGNAGCNNFSGPYTLGDNRALTLGPLVSTLRACADAAVNERESAYLAALQQVTNYTKDGDGRLRLVAGDIVLTYGSDNMAPTPNTLPDTGTTPPLLPWLVVSVACLMVGVAIRRGIFLPKP